jgi:hypothetical protein
MTDNQTQPTQRRGSGRRIGLILTGAVAGLLALAALGVGAAAFSLDGEKNDRGYLTTDSERFATGARALATDNLDVDLDGVDWLVDSDDLGKVELEVTSNGDEPLFVGIGRTQDVATYLRGVEHTRVTDLDTNLFEGSDPFEASYLREPGERRPGAPEKQSFWAASAQGRGTQTLDWQLEDGDWSIVLMNADGSRGVAADVSAGAMLSFLDELGWSAAGVGGGLLLLALTLTVLGVRPPRNRPPQAPAGEAAPVAG